MRTTAPLRTVLWAHRERPSPVGTGARVLALARAATAWRRRGSPGKEITLNHPRESLRPHASEGQVLGPISEHTSLSSTRKRGIKKQLQDKIQVILPNFGKVPSPNLITLTHGSFCRTSAKSQAQTSSRLRMVHFADLRQRPKAETLCGLKPP